MLRDKKKSPAEAKCDLLTRQMENRPQCLHGLMSCGHNLLDIILPPLRCVSQSPPMPALNNREDRLPLLLLVDQFFDERCRIDEAQHGDEKWDFIESRNAGWWTDQRRAGII
ncbi:hypothetical protein DPEC_G00358950 [Dallia pectoralis]|uniref:Uncharacterized protein n=1 Tax=Dallia pectoralis TaxID=75939 RepID=A0ACC2F0H5_DALPE|nr:hypothetical protein DPEC_G00358950 [Dallia pectoralis]